MTIVMNNSIKKSHDGSVCMPYMDPHLPSTKKTSFFSINLPYMDLSWVTAHIQYVDERITRPSKGPGRPAGESVLRAQILNGQWPAMNAAENRG